eukprot:COSAG01_NODE_507_length_16108_cov_18.603973_17_plen_105_part_00
MLFSERLCRSPEVSDDVSKAPYFSQPLNIIITPIGHCAFGMQAAQWCLLSVFGRLANPKDPASTAGDQAEPASLTSEEAIPRAGYAAASAQARGSETKPLVARV